MMKRRFTYKALAGQRGFTLVEVLVVLAVIGILAGIAVPTFLSQREQAQDAAAKSVVRNAATTVVMYRTREGGYPLGDLASVDEMEEIQPTINWVESRNIPVPLTSDSMTGPSRSSR